MKKQIKTHIALISPKGKVTVPLQLCYDDGEDIVNPASEINLNYNGVEFQGKGTDNLWIDTFADLQNNLPQDVFLSRCMTCCYGNMCPYGNAKNQLFCTKDLTISNKNDMCNLFDETDPFEERQVSYFDCCDKFTYQSNNHYTYNDYLYQLNKKKCK